MDDYGSLAMFRELVMLGVASRSNEMGAALEARLVGQPWTRNRTKEAGASSNGGGRGSWLAFDRAEQGGIPAATLFIVAPDVGSDDMVVTNIVPQTERELSVGQYNSIICEFYDLAVRPVCDAAGIKHELTPDALPLTHWLTESAAEKLRRFSQSGAKSAIHPLDRDRWFDFLTQIAKDKSDLDTDTLERWLVNISRWPAESARNLVAEYEFGRGLLKYAQEHSNA